MARMRRGCGACGRRSLTGAGPGRTVRTTASRRPGTGSPLGPHAPRLPPPPGADRRWVVDFTRVPTRSGLCCTAFVTGPVLPPHRRPGPPAAARGTDNAAGAPGQAIRARKDRGGGDLEGLVHHSDHGSQYLSIAHAGRLVDEGTGRIGRSRGLLLRGRRRPGPGQAPASAGPVLARRPLEGPRRPPGPPPPDG